jgi:hypothetical protein
MQISTLSSFIPHYFPPFLTLAQLMPKGCNKANDQKYRKQVKAVRNEDLALFSF